MGDEPHVHRVGKLVEQASLSARIPFTVSLLLALAQRILHPGKPRFAGFLGNANALKPHLFGDVGTNLLVFLVQIGLVFAIITLDDSDFLAGEAGNPADDLFVGTSFLKIRYKVLDGDAARGELQSSAAIDNLNGLGFHGFSFRVWANIIQAFYRKAARNGTNLGSMFTSSASSAESPAASDSLPAGSAIVPSGCVQTDRAGSTAQMARGGPARG